MENYKIFDLNNWERKEHYLYYTNNLNIEFSITVQLRVDQLLRYCHTSHRRFYAMFICLAAQVVNETDCLKMFRNETGTLCVWNHVHPVYTLFHNDDKTFSDCWSVYHSDPDQMYQTLVSDMETYKDVKGKKKKNGQPANFFCVSCVPWTNFTGYTSRVTNGQPQLFPVITAGKYLSRDDGVFMPVAVATAHAVCDGYHISLFFDRLQQLISQL